MLRKLLDAIRCRPRGGKVASRPEISDDIPVILSQGAYLGELEDKYSDEFLRQINATGNSSRLGATDECGWSPIDSLPYCDYDRNCRVHGAEPDGATPLRPTI